ncbi:MAG: translation initiation factor IF-3 [bacterium]|jgi:translation initiation factor IF-3
MPAREPQDSTRINAEIRESEVRLIDNEGNHIGVVPIKDALQRAMEAGLDLVEVGTKATPPVCRIMDYGQFRYEKSKKEKEAKKKQKQITVKEIKMRPRIDQHDYDFKLSHAEKFLEHGDKVRFIMQFRGREMAHKDIGRQVMDRVIQDLSEVATVEQEPRQEGKFMNMTLTPSLKKKKKSDTDKDIDTNNDGSQGE